MKQPDVERAEARLRALLRMEVSERNDSMCDDAEDIAEDIDTLLIELVRLRRSIAVAAAPLTHAWKSKFKKRDSK
jgi:hypothetical protein